MEGGKVINIPFDQYQRYKTTSDIINKCRCENEKFRILEVGANAHRNLEKFLPHDNIIYIDIDFPDETQCNNMIKGDATDMEFEDNSFDIIVALDVYEHIPAERRDLFLKEINRVAKNGFIIGAPFNYDKTREAEYRVNALYKSLYGSDFIWLKEHIANSLPDGSKTKKFLNLNEIPYIILYHGNIDIWEKLMSMYFLSVKNEASQNYKKELDSFYNKYIYPVDFSDSGENVYRSFVIGGYISQNKALQELLKYNDIEIREKEYARLLNLCGNFLNILNEKNRINEELNEYVEVFVDDKNFKINLFEENIISDKFYERYIPFDNINIKNGVRIDPCNKKCLIYIENIFLKHNEQVIIAEFVTNATIQSSKVFYFAEDDPQIQITNCVGKELTGIIIKFKYLQYNDINIEPISCLIKMSAENIDTEKKHMDSQTRMLKENVVKLNNLEEIIESKFDDFKSEIAEKNKIIYEMKIIIDNNDKIINELNENINYINLEMESIKNMSIFNLIRWVKNRRK